MKESTHISPQTKKGLAFSSDYTPRTYGGYVLDQERYCHILERYCSFILNVNVCAKIWDKPLFNRLFWQEGKGKFRPSTGHEDPERE